MKTCTKCGVEKAVSEFSVNRSTKDNLNYYCRSCAKQKFKAWSENNVAQEKERCKQHYLSHSKEKYEYNKNWIANNRDKVLAQKKRHYLKNKEKILVKTAQYYRNNFENLAKAKKIWNLNNSDKMKAYFDDYWRSNKDKYYQRNANRRAFKLQACVSWADLDKIKAIYAEAQRLTEITGLVHHVDHIIPLQSKYVCGLHHENNLQILTWYENLTKSNKFTPG